jgi:hypothetical protein
MNIILCFRTLVPRGATFLIIDPTKHSDRTLGLFLLSSLWVSPFYRHADYAHEIRTPCYTFRVPNELPRASLSFTCKSGNAFRIREIFSIPRFCDHRQRLPTVLVSTKGSRPKRGMLLGSKWSLSTLRLIEWKYSAVIVMNVWPLNVGLPSRSSNRWDPDRSGKLLAEMFSFDHPSLCRFRYLECFVRNIAVPGLPRTLIEAGDQA